MTAGVATKIFAPIMGGFAMLGVRVSCPSDPWFFFVAPATNIQQGRCIPFSPVDPQVGSVLCSHVQRQSGATQSRLVRRGKGADEYSLTSPLL